MIKGLNKADNETEFEYIKRITKAKSDKTLDIDYTEWARYVYGKEYSSDVARRMFYGVDRLLDVINEEEFKIVRDNTEEELILEIEEKKKELLLEKIRVQDEKKINSKYMRALARHERILDTLKSELSNIEPMQYKEINKIENGSKQASLLISDLHYGIRCNNYWNKYDMEIAKERMFKLVRDTVEYCKVHKVSTLHIELLGDLASGYIHKTLELENEVNVVQQVINCSELLSVCINELADNIENVNVYMTCGNHGRMSKNYKESVDAENFEYFIWEYLKIRCNRDDIEYVENDIDETFIHYEIDGEHIFGTHGHLDKVTSVAEKFATMFNGVKIKAIHCGHLHHEYTDCINNIKVVMNSTASGVDTHSKNMRYIGNPSQTLLIYDGKNTINFNIEL